jgi:hypothetical protein
MPDLWEKVVGVAFVAVIVMSIVVAVVGMFMGSSFLPPPAGCTDGDKRVVVHIDGLNLIGTAVLILAFALSWYIIEAMGRL